MKNQIGTPSTIKIDDLNVHYRNPRKGNIPVIAESLLINGQFKPIVVNKGTHTGRPNEVLAGNHTLKAARTLQKEGKFGDVLDAYIVDVDEDEATRIVLADNRTSDMATYDNDALLGLLNDLDDVDGTGYTDQDVNDLIEGVAEEHIPDVDDGEDIADGTLIRRWGETDGDPDIMPERGTLWELGKHLLVVADLHTDWDQYINLLEGDDVLYPYPTLLAPWSNTFRDRRAVFVQPSPFLAGWLITKWNRLTPNDPAEQIEVEQ